MRRLAIVLLFPLAALGQFTIPHRSGATASHGGGGTGPTLSFVQGCNNLGSTGTITCAMGSNVASGNILIGVSKAASNIAAVPTITSTSGTCTWSTINISGNVGSLYTAVAFYCQIPASEAETVQVAWASSLANFSDIAIAEYHSSSGWQTPALDVSMATAATAVSTPCVTGSTAATAQATELVTAVCEAYNSAQTWTNVSPYVNQATASRNTLGWFDQTTTSAGVQSFSTAITADDYYGIIAAFKPN